MHCTWNFLPPDLVRNNMMQCPITTDITRRQSQRTNRNGFHAPTNQEMLPPQLRQNPKVGRKAIENKPPTSSGLPKSSSSKTIDIFWHGFLTDSVLISCGPFLPAPAPDNATNVSPVDGLLGPATGERDVGTFWTLIFRQVAKSNPHRNHGTLTNY